MSFVDFVLQLKALWIMIVGVLGFVYFVKSGALQEITGSWKRRYEAAIGERDDALRRCDLKDEKIKDQDKYIQLLILNDRTRMEIELQRKQNA